MRYGTDVGHHNPPPSSHIFVRVGDLVICRAISKEHEKCHITTLGSARIQLMPQNASCYLITYTWTTSSCDPCSEKDAGTHNLTRNDPQSGLDTKTLRLLEARPIDLKQFVHDIQSHVCWTLHGQIKNIRKVCR